MTARSERAVRAGPGAASDRREIIGALPVPLQDPESSVRGIAATVRDWKSERQRPSQEKSSPQKGGGKHRQLSTAGGYASESPPSIVTGQTLARRERPELPWAGPAIRSQREFLSSVPKPYQVLNELEHPGTFEIVMLLDQEGRTNPYRMRQRLRPGQKALNRALRSLVRTRLIQPAKSESFPFSTGYELTKRGKMLAETMHSWPLILLG